MKRHGTLLLLAVFIAFVAAQASASTPALTASSSRTPGLAPHAHLLKPKSAAPSDNAPAKPSHLFTVTDEKGLVLTCIAPEIDTNPDTDLFKSCTLAPGRTLDDVMHTFVQGIHYEQSQHQKEREEWQRNLDEKTPQNSAQKQ